MLENFLTDELPLAVANRSFNCSRPVAAKRRGERHLRQTFKTRLEQRRHHSLHGTTGLIVG
jgi:hypothetical protein